MKKIGLVLYAIAGAGVLLADLTGIDWLHLVCKPLLMPALLWYYWVSVAPDDRDRSLILALLFSFVGDLLLLKADYFLGGLVAFLVAHILYIVAYRQHRSEENEVSLQGLQRMRLSFPIILGGTGLIVILYPILGDLRIPVIIYALVVMLMVIAAIFRMGRTSASSFWMVFSGAVFFMISDSMIAMNKFLEPLPYAGFWIMLTYTLAQFFIVEGLIRHHETHSG